LRRRAMESAPGVAGRAGRPLYGQGICGRRQQRRGGQLLRGGRVRRLSLATRGVDVGCVRPRGQPVRSRVHRLGDRQRRKRPVLRTGGRQELERRADGVVCVLAPRRAPLERGEQATEPIRPCRRDATRIIYTYHMTLLELTDSDTSTSY